MKFQAAILLFPISALGAPSVLRFIPRQSSQVQITSVTASGSGCPQGSITTDIADDNSTVTLGFDSYQTFVGPGASGSSREMNCDVFLTLQFPLGCTSAVVDTTYHGFAQLESGVSGTFPASYSVSPGSASGGNPPGTTFDAASWGSGGVYTKDDTVTVTERIGNSNQQIVLLAVRNRISLQAANSTVSGTLTIDDATVGITGVTSC